MNPIQNLLIIVILLSTIRLSATQTLHCPPDQTFPCTAQTQDLMAYGDAYVMKNGQKYDAGLAHVIYNVNSCNVGTIIRKWQVEDVNGQILECRQTLTFEAGEFSEADIVWPETELHLTGCDDDLDNYEIPSEYDEPVIYFGHCTHVGTNYDDEVYIFGSDCKKILRHWTVINWCKYIPGTSVGKYTFTQVFKLSNGEEPIINCVPEFKVDATGCSNSYVNVPFLSIQGESCSGGYRVTNNSIYADTTTHDASGVYPIGKTTFLYTISYACGLEKKCQTTVHVTDKISPVPYCLATINIVLMPVDSDGDGQTDEGMVDLWAKDVNVGSYHPCHNRPLSYSFSGDSLQMSRTFTCQDVGLNDIRMYVRDDQGLQSYCRVHVVVQNNGANIPNCTPQTGSRALASGMVTDPIGTPIEDVMVFHKDSAPITEQLQNGGSNTVHYVSSQRTQNDGTYSTDDLMLHRDYKLYAYKAGDVNRVDDVDIAILEAFIKGERYFANPYTYLAADINEDGKVDVNDYHLIRNLRGATEAQWPDQRQWVFYTHSSVDNMGNPSSDNEMQLLQDYNIQSLYYGYAEDKNFIGILKGDLDYYETLGM